MLIVSACMFPLSAVHFFRWSNKFPLHIPVLSTSLALFPFCLRNIDQGLSCIFWEVVQNFYSVHYHTAVIIFRLLLLYFLYVYADTADHFWLGFVAAAACRFLACCGITFLVTCYKIFSPKNTLSHVDPDVPDNRISGWNFGQSKFHHVIIFWLCTANKLSDDVQHCHA